MHNEAAITFQQKVEEEQNENSSVTFHAKPLPKSTYDQSFNIKIPEREPLVAISINLHADQRALERAKFDEKISRQLSNTSVERQKQQAEKDRAEKEAIKKLRSLSVADGGLLFTATPVMLEDPFPCKQVDAAPLTDPKSPFFKSNYHASRNSLVAVKTVSAEIV